MDKQEAIEFILQELNNNCDQEEIAFKLSQRLGAPADVVRKFIARVASENPVPASYLNQPVAPPSEVLQTPSIPEAVQQAPSSLASAQPRTSTPVEPAVIHPSVSENPPAAIDTRKPGQDDPETEKLILSALVKNRRNDDIVLAVCERTGISWDQAQRWVARIASQNRKKLTSRQNVFLIPLSLLALLGGLVLLYSSFSEMNLAYKLVIALTSSPTSRAPIEQPMVQEGAWALLVGLGLTLGGGLGLFKALQSQFE